MKKSFLGLTIIFLLNSANATTVGDIVAKACINRITHKLTEEQIKDWQTTVKGNYRYSGGYSNFHKPYPESDTGKCLVATYYDSDSVRFSKVEVKLTKNFLEFN